MLSSVVRGSSSIPQYIPIPSSTLNVHSTYWKSSVKDRFVASYLHQQRTAIACIQVNLHVICNTRSLCDGGQSGSRRETRSRCSLCGLTAAMCLAPHSWHRTHCCAKVASVESPYSPRCCSSFSSLKRRPFIMSTPRPKILKWCHVPKWSLPTIR